MAVVLVYGDFDVPPELKGTSVNFFFIRIPEGRIPWSKKIAPAINRIVQSFVPSPQNGPYRRPKVTKTEDGYLKTYYTRERKRKAHWNVEGDPDGTYAAAWNEGKYLNYDWTGTEFVKI